MENQIDHKYYLYQNYQKLFKMSIIFVFGGGMKNGYVKIGKSSEEEKSSR